MLVRKELNMNEKNGFTLVELLGAIAILAIIAGIAFPAVQTTIKKNRENTYVEQINSIISAADKYVVDPRLDNNEEPLSDTLVNGITISKLITKGYLKNSGNIIDPITGGNLQGCILIKWDEYDLENNPNGTNQYLIRYYNLDDEHESNNVGKPYTNKISSYYDKSTDPWNVNSTINTTTCTLSN